MQAIPCYEESIPYPGKSVGALLSSVLVHVGFVLLRSRFQGAVKFPNSVCCYKATTPAARCMLGLY